MANPAALLGLGVSLAALSACGAADSAVSAGNHAPRTGRVTCTPANLTATPDGAWAYGHGTSSVGIWLKLRAKGQPCTFATRPSVVVDSGYGPDPAIDGTADPDADVVAGLVVPSSGLRLLVSWSAECEPNHKAPVVRLMVGPLGEERVPVAAGEMPRSLGRVYCWNDGVELGMKAWA